MSGTRSLSNETVKKLLAERNGTEKLPKIVPPQRYLCTWCSKQNESICAIKYIIFGKIFERSVCKSCIDPLLNTIKIGIGT